MGTTVTFKGKVYTLTQDAYICGTRDNEYYTALATDENGKKYDIIWYPVEGWEYLEDGGEHCDWENPDEVNEI
jgi:hypothetical protein